MHCNFGRTCGEHVRSSVRATIKVHSIVGKVQSSTWYGSKFDPPVQSSVHFNRTSSTFKVDRAWKCVNKTRRFLECVCLRRRQFSVMFKAAKGSRFMKQKRLLQCSNRIGPMFRRTTPKFNLIQTKVQFKLTLVPQLKNDGRKANNATISNRDAFENKHVLVFLLLREKNN